MSLEKYSHQKIGDKILDLYGNLHQIHACVADLIEHRDVESVLTIEAWLDELDRNSVALRNSIVTLGSVVAGTTEEDGEMEIDVVPDERGLRF